MTAFAIFRAARRASKASAALARAEHAATYDAVKAHGAHTVQVQTAVAQQRGEAQRGTVQRHTRAHDQAAREIAHVLQMMHAEDVKASLALKTIADVVGTLRAQCVCVFPYAAISPPTHPSSVAPNEENPIHLDRCHCAAHTFE